MQIEIGRYYVNKTWKYLLPIIKSFGNTFLVKYSSIWKLGTGIYDHSFNGKYIDDKLLFILFDKKVKPKIFNNILEYFKYQDYYHSDYAYDDIEEGRMHMVVFKVPEQYYDAYDFFMKGQYSQMYSEDEISFLFKATEKGLDVMHRTEEAYNRMIVNTKKSFNVDITKNDLIGAELDFPIENNKEIFNYL